MLASILIFLLISISLSQLWSHSKVFSRVRGFITKIPLIRDALLCPPCASFWSALFLTLFLNPLLPILPMFIANVSISVVNYAICGILYKKNILTDD
jgi:hypothetical protein